MVKEKNKTKKPTFWENIKPLVMAVIITLAIIGIVSFYNHYQNISTE